MQAYTATRQTNPKKANTYEKVLHHLKDGDIEVVNMQPELSAWCMTTND